jgi:hypothetical protein
MHGQAWVEKKSRALQLSRPNNDQVALVCDLDDLLHRLAGDTGKPDL